MKKSYIKPVAMCFDMGKSEFPMVGAALAGGYVIGRAVAHAMKASPVIKLKNLGRWIVVVYDFFKDKIPRVIALKTRENEDFLIAESDGLDIFYLNETAKNFLELCDGKRKIEEIKEMFLKDYVIDENSLEQDIVNLIRDLQWKNIIRLEDKKWKNIVNH